jgi:hypothetical protein
MPILLGLSIEKFKPWIEGENKTNLKNVIIFVNSTDEQSLKQCF